MRWQTSTSGQFLFNIVGTWQPTLDRQFAPGSTFSNSAGYNLGVLEWRGNGGVTWQDGPWTVGWNAQYYHSYFVYSATSTDAVIAAAVLNQGSARIPSQTYHDLVVTHRFADAEGAAGGVLSGTEWSLGIQNVFDKTPPILASISSAPTSAYSLYGDGRMRRFTLTVRKHF